ncbi:MAG: tetratricopeptide repeat protein [Richelia sp. SL_2_1]|nr:tetratricopeptide repeat protein [Richelia sp. SL_2_1]
MNKFIALVSTFLLLPYPTLALEIASNPSSQPASESSYCQLEAESEELSEKQLQSLASKITVKVTGDNNGGSGTLLAKQGNSYLVLTNAHVVRGVNSISLKTADGKTYPAEIVKQTNFEKSDLALLKFKSSSNYCVVEVGEVPDKDMPVLAAGFSGEKGEIVFRTGQVKQVLGQSLKEGYQIGYSSDIEQGMSGGPIISSQGMIVGVNGRGAYPILNSGYVYQNGSRPSEVEIQEMRKLSWGIPASTFLAQVNGEILTAYGLPLPKSQPTVPTTQLTGWLGELEQKAKQITVRIDSSSTGNGSGVIIAKNGDTYTVLTAAHVVCEREDATKPCGNYNYQILAPDGKQYPVEKSTIKTEEGVDLGVVKFIAPNQNYQLATLANYNPNNFEYMLTAGYPKLGNNSPWRLTMGQIFEKERGLLQSNQSDFQTDSSSQLQTASSLTGGYELVYSSITYGGMSGGPVLDSLGRVIGIHGRAEGEQAFDEKTGDRGTSDGKVQLGYSLGIPTTTFLGLATRLGVQAQKLETKAAPQLKAEQRKSIQAAILTTDVSKGNATASQWIERGNQLWRLARYQEAVTAFDEAIDLKPAFVYLAYYGKGLALGSSGEVPEAIEALKSATKLKPDFVAAWQLLSTAYREFQQPEKGLVAIEKAIQLQPKNPNLYNEKQELLKNLKRYAEAEAAINKAIDLNPRTAFYNNRGLIYKEQKKWELTLANFNKAIEINPQYADAYINRGNLYYEQKQWELALDNFNKTIEINPRYAQAYINRGNLYYEQKQWELALANFDKAIEINPKYAQVYNNRGILYKDQKQWELAFANFDKAIEINPQYAEAYISRGVLYKEQKKWKLALADYTKAIEINPQYAKAYNNRGNLYSEQKQWELALADYNKAIAINPQFAEAYYNRGLFYGEQKKWNLALADFNKILQVASPEYPGGYFGRGMVYALTGEKQKAIPDLQRAAQLFYAQGNSAAYEQAMNLLKSLQ